MSGHSENELVAWLKERSRMFNWGMIAVMDRAKANRLLTQEYIRHFAEGSYLPAQSGEVISDGWKNIMENAVLDVPRLSFENASLSNSKAKLRMAMVSGKRIRLENRGEWQVRRIDQYGPQLSPELEMDLNLSDVPGGVKEGGELFLDLQKSSNFSFGLVGPEIEQRDVGAFFGEMFEGLDKSKRIYGLGKIKEGSNEAMRPDKFLLRTQPRDPKTTDGDGALVSFIRLEGDEDGSFPTSNDTFKYLIPHDAGKDYSAAVSITSGRLAISQMLQGLREMAPGATFDLKYTEQNGRRVFTGARMTAGQLPVTGEVIELTDISDSWEGLDALFEVYKGECDLADNLEVHVDSSGKKVEFSCTLKGELKGELHSVTCEDEIFKSLLEAFPDVFDPLWGVKSANYEYSVRGSYVLEGEGGGQLRSTSFTFETIRAPDFFEDLSSQQVFSGWEDFFKAILEALLLAIFAPIAAILAATLEEIRGNISLRGYLEKALKKDFPLMAPTQALIKETLDYNFNNAIVADRTHLPLDAVAFGKVSPTLTSFVVDDLEPVLFAGSTKKFSTIPVRNDVQWSVEPKGCGHVDPQTGEYTAPAVEDLDGPFIRARVIAKSSGAESSALVTVVRQRLMLSPLVVTALPDDEVRLEASGLGSMVERIWRIKNENPHGRIKAPGVNAPEVIYVAGNDDKNAYLFDTIEVEDTVTNEKCTGVIITKTKALELNVSIVDSDVETGTLRLQGSINGEVVEADWALSHGPGKVSKSEKEGIYTVGDTGNESFAVISGSHLLGGIVNFTGMIIIPLPLTPDNLALATLCKGNC
ncbi:hypothetical protein [Pseudomonas guariconensis]|uniref:hypothetical protein n=1 Tax=Pseudomonas guariconensis TaxID=1288410 RepID=UPI0018AA3B79|nr:hypothetical protein [Pseudomonas guariconensis]MBF8722153.1 hypothetical protein [Pseudomonas guariconensis]